MGHLRNRLNRIEDKLNPPEGTVILTGESKEETKKKYREYLANGGNPNAQFIFFIAPEIKKDRD